MSLSRSRRRSPGVGPGLQRPPRATESGHEHRPCRVPVVTAPLDREGDARVPHVPHHEFRDGLAHGRLRVVVDPKRARPYVVGRTRIDLLAASVIGMGAVLALAGQAWPGLMLVALGIVANQLVRQQSARIVLHLASADPAVYDEVTGNGVMEVRRHPS